jgi:hypothetical protein
MFAYDPLDLRPDSRQIRLLKILPAPSISGDLRCTISDALLKPKENPAYEALSYVWGKEDNKVRTSLGYGPEHAADGSRKPDVDNGKTASDQGLQHEVTQISRLPCDISDCQTWRERCGLVPSASIRKTTMRRITKSSKCDRLSGFAKCGSLAGRRGQLSNRSRIPRATAIVTK